MDGLAEAKLVIGWFAHEGLQTRQTTSRLQALAAQGATVFLKLETSATNDGTAPLTC